MMDTSVKCLPSGWQLIEKLGEGSYGIVYRAQRTMDAITEVAAIKHISIPKNDADLNSIVDDVGGTQDDVNRYLAQLRDLILDEYRKMANLQGHTNIVSCQDVECYSKQSGVGYDVYIRMELLESVSKRIREGRMDREDTIKLGMDICRALDLLCQNRIIHRDIKPQNLFVNANGDYKLGDFGTARSIAGTSTMMSVKGTFAYMAPEVMLNQKVSYASDIYSLGLVMYRLMNGNKPPFIHPEQAGSVTSTDAATTKRLQGVALPPPAYADQELAEVILKACAFEPRNRWQSAAEMYNALADLSGTKPRPPLPTPPPEEDPNEEGMEDVTVSNPPRKNKWWIVVLILLLVAGSLLGYLLTEGRIVWPPVTPTPTPKPNPTPTRTSTCQHTNKVMVEGPQYDMHDYNYADENGHDYTFSYDWYYLCEDCQEVVGDITTGGGIQYEKHTYKNGVCTACGYVRVSSTPTPTPKAVTPTRTPKACTHKNTAWRTKAATCTEYGSETCYCVDCGHVINTYSTAKKDHSYEYVVTKAPTCGETGVHTYTCSLCGDSYDVTVSATLNHNYTSSVTREATCVSHGIRTYTCQGCEKTYTEVIPVKEHREEVVSVEDHKCMTYGQIYYICPDCNHEWWVPTPPWPHEYENDKCIWCGRIDVP